jgi:hypothetical protein
MYDQTIYLLDLCILSYHLHAQTLIWPMDPYYEQMTKNKVDLQRTSANRRKRRNHLIDQMCVREERQSSWTWSCPACNY